MELLGHACWILAHIDGAVTYTTSVFADVRSSIRLRTTTGIKSLHNLDGHQRPAGHTEAAEESFQRASSTVDGIFRFEHYILGAKSSILLVGFRPTRLSTSIECYREALALQGRLQGSILHPEVTKKLFILFIVYGAMGTYDLALGAIKRIAASREADFGIEQARTAGALTVMALVYEDMGKETKAVVERRN